MRSCIHHGGKVRSVCQTHAPDTISKVLIILVVETLAAAIVAVGDAMLVIANELLPDRSVKKGLVLMLGGNAFIANEVLEGFIKVHKILA